MIKDVLQQSAMGLRQGFPGSHILVRSVSTTQWSEDLHKSLHHQVFLAIASFIIHNSPLASIRGFGCSPEMPAFSKTREDCNSTDKSLCGQMKKRAICKRWATRRDLFREHRAAALQACSATCMASLVSAKPHRLECLAERTWMHS